jgi:DNA-binding NarL/FixJ family response regulator
VILLCGGADSNIDVRMVEHILASQPDARVVVLAPDADDKSLHSFVTAGAFGLVNLQLDGFDALVSAIHRAAAGEFLLSSDTVRRIIQYQRTEAVRQRRRADLIHQLTDRELEVLALVACGLDNRTIAEKLYVSVTTVRSHVQHLLAKLGLHSRLQAAVLANQYELAADTAQVSRPTRQGMDELDVICGDDCRMGGCPYPACQCAEGELCQCDEGEL